MMEESPPDTPAISIRLHNSGTPSAEHLAEDYQPGTRRIIEGAGGEEFVSDMGVGDYEGWRPP